MAQMRYVDDRGQTHWVQSPDQIPPQYRGQADSPQLPAMGTGSYNSDFGRMNEERRAKEFEEDREKLRQACIRAHKTDSACDEVRRQYWR